MSDTTAAQWWSSRRPKYNRGLLIAGILAFVAYIVIGSTLLRNNTEFEVTIFTTLFQGIAFLVMVAVANAFYSLGLISERIVSPKNPDQYRRICYRLGFWLSVLLPFSIPVLLLTTELLSRNHVQP